MSRNVCVGYDLERISMQKIYINPPFIKLEQFLKFCASASTGGEAKLMIQGGGVKINGGVCLMRGKKLFGGEIISLTGSEDESFEVAVKTE